MKIEFELGTLEIYPFRRPENMKWLTRVFAGLSALGCFLCISITTDIYAQQGPAQALTDGRNATRIAADLVDEMTLEEKLQFIGTSKNPNHFAGFIQGVPRLKIPDVVMDDSTTGVGDWNGAVGTAFPAAIALAASWDAPLNYEYGAEIAKQLRANGVSMGLGGNVNILRDPRYGRIFENLGEDPLLAGQLISQRTKGTQDNEVIATVKHFVGNDQETNRIGIGKTSKGREIPGGDSTIDERTLREIYLLPFEIAVEADDPPGNIMCAYNSINDYQSCENRELLTGVLKGEWGFQGQVQSDWGATAAADLVEAINAGLDEKEGDIDLKTVRAALVSGTISEARLDDMVTRKLRTMVRVGLMDDPPKKAKIDFDEGSMFAQRAIENSIVLLKNSRPQSARKVLPLSPAKPSKIVVVGGNADIAILAGGGSGNSGPGQQGALCGETSLFDTNSGTQNSSNRVGCDRYSDVWKKLKTPLVSALRELVPAATVTYTGYQDASMRDKNPFKEYSDSEIGRAVALAKSCDIAIVVVTQITGEANDLPSLSLANPSNQDLLVEKVAEANPNTIVVIEGANPVLMPWKDKVAAILEAWYPGEGGGKALANILFGKINPSGKLPLTFPAREDQTPTGGGKFADNPNYSEGLQVGYRWYDVKKEKPAFAFGFGLSYTTFRYSKLLVHSAKDGTKTIKFNLTNTGKVAGKEIAQVYMSFPADYLEPPKRLVGWQKVALSAGETKMISISISPRRQSYWNTVTKTWDVMKGGKVLIGASSRDIRLRD